MSGTRWDGTEIGRLWDVFPESAWPEILAAFPNRTKSMIRNKVRELGIRRITNRKPKWSANEILFLRKHYRTASWEMLQQGLPRHRITSIQKKATSIGMFRDRMASRATPIIAKLRAIRRNSRISIKTLCKSVRLHPVLFSKYETGAAPPPRIDIVVRWAEALGHRVELVSMWKKEAT